MKKLLLSLFIILASCSSKSKKDVAFVPQSSGNINDVAIVMPEKEWQGALGQTVREVMQTPYEGLPFDEPEYSLRYINPKAFSGFARQSRNVLWFQKDSVSRFQLMQDAFASPQILASITGEDSDVMGYNLKENENILRRTIAENERVEKLRRIKKSLAKPTALEERFGFTLTYPTAYKTVKDTTNFIWIQKEVVKGHLNLIAYTLPLAHLGDKQNNRIIEIRDSIGKNYIPGRLPGSYMITEAAYRPYFYTTTLEEKSTYLTKGTWEVKNDFMAGPFINFMIKDTNNDRWIVLEGFAFAPSASKRDYMFELNAIISTFKSQ